MNTLLILVSLALVGTVSAASGSGTAAVQCTTTQQAAATKCAQDMLIQAAFNLANKCFKANGYVSCVQQNPCVCTDTSVVIGALKNNAKAAFTQAKNDKCTVKSICLGTTSTVVQTLTFAGITHTSILPTTNAGMTYACAYANSATAKDVCTITKRANCKVITSCTHKFVPVQYSTSSSKGTTSASSATDCQKVQSGSGCASKLSLTYAEGVSSKIAVVAGRRAAAKATFTAAAPSSVASKAALTTNTKATDFVTTFLTKLKAVAAAADIPINLSAANIKAGTPVVGTGSAGAVVLPSLLMSVALLFAALF